MSWVGIDAEGLAERRARLMTAYAEIASVRRSIHTVSTTVGEHVDVMALMAIEGFTEGWSRRIDDAVAAVRGGDRALEWTHTLEMLGTADGALLRLVELGQGRLNEIEAEIDTLRDLPHHLVVDRLQELENQWWEHMSELAGVLAGESPGEGWEVWQATAAYHLFHLNLKPPDENLAAQSADRIRELLDQGWVGDVSRGELLAIGEIFAGLDPTTATLVSATLTDGNWSRILGELDGARGGNLNVEEESELFATLVTRLSAEEIWRVMTAEDKGPEILLAATQFAPPPNRFDLTHQASLHLNGRDSELALSAALGLLTTMADADQQATTALLAQSGTLADLFDAADQAQAELLAAQEHGHPVGEFFQGVGGAVKGIWDGAYGLTLQVLTDPHQWSENWGDVGRLLELAFNHPGDFLYQVADIDTLKDVPGYWLGGLVPDIAAAALTGGTVTAVSRGSKLARLANALRAVKRLTPDSIRNLRHLDVSTIRTTLGTRLDDVLTRLKDETGAVRGRGELPSSRTDRLDELSASGVRHTPDAIVHIGRDPSGQIVFLETGTNASGLQHILEAHADDFVNAGMATTDIGELVFKAVTEGRIVGTQGLSRPIFEVRFGGKTHRVAMTVGTNGYIVGANPR